MILMVLLKDLCLLLARVKWLVQMTMAKRYKTDSNRFGQSIHIAGELGRNHMFHDLHS